MADCLSLFSLLHQSLLNGQPMPPTMPIFERLAYHSLKRGDPVSQGGPAQNAQSAQPITNPSTADAQGSTSSQATTVTSDRDSEGEIIGSLEAQEDNRALQLLDGPFTWQMGHVSNNSIA